jgi:probable phosphoglycerate mutase
MPETPEIVEACEVLLVRHALPEPDGTKDPSLGEIGREQAELVGAYLADQGISAIYSSQLKRAFETAEPLARRLNFRIVVDERLQEWKSNATHYQGVENLTDVDRARSFREGRFEEGFLPEHNHDELRENMFASVRDIGFAHQGQRIVAVSHGGASNSFLAGILDSPRRFFYNPGYTSISRVQVWPDGRFVLISINETAHLSK